MGVEQARGRSQGIPRSVVLLLTSKGEGGSMTTGPTDEYDAPEQEQVDAPEQDHEDEDDVEAAEDELTLQYFLGDVSLPEFLEDARVMPHEAGVLHVPSGRVAARDPACGTEPAFRRTIPPGSYRVVAGLTEMTDVAYLALWVKDTPIVRAELAFLDERNEDGDAHPLWRGACQYGVDAGLGCFVDATLASAARAAVRAAIDAKDPVVLYGDWHYLNYHVGAGNVVMCRSGFGDGYYPTYVGLDAQGDVVCFVTDFGPLHDDEEDDEE